VSRLLSVHLVRSCVAESFSVAGNRHKACVVLQDGGDHVFLRYRHFVLDIVAFWGTSISSLPRS
jgi:hypothetical protein